MNLSSSAEDPVARLLEQTIEEVNADHQRKQNNGEATNSVVLNRARKGIFDIKDASTFVCV